VGKAWLPDDVGELPTQQLASLLVIGAIISHDLHNIFWPNAVNNLFDLLGGLGRLQGGAATGGGRVPCREADGKPTGPLQEADARRVPCREADARRVPCREAELQSRRRTGALQAAGRTRSSGRRRRDASRGTLEAIRRCATDCAAQTVLGPSSNSRAGNSFPAPFFPSSRSRANVFSNVYPINATLPHRSAFNLD